MTWLTRFVVLGGFLFGMALAGAIEGGWGT